MAGALAGGRVVTSCADLPDWNAEGCGNGVINKGEDCDGDNAPDGGPLACGAPGTAQQCRYTCSHASASDMGVDDNPGCPSGYRCGADNICRGPSGQFELVDQGTLPHPRTGMVFADADNDGRLDLFSRDQFFTDVDYFDDLGHSTRTVHYRTPLLPSVGEITDDKRADFAFSGETNGIVLMRGQSDRSFLPTASSLLDFPESIRAAFTLRAVSDTQGDLQVAIGSTTMGIVSNNRILRTPLTGPSDDTGVSLGFAVGDLITGPDSIYEEFVIARSNADTLDVYAVKNDGTPLDGGAPMYSVKLSGLMVRSFFLADTNADDHLDLVIAASTGLESAEVPLTKVYRALGKAQGGFDPATEWAAAKLPENTYRLLAVGDVDRNGSPALIVLRHDPSEGGKPMQPDTGMRLDGVWICYTTPDSTQEPKQLLTLVSTGSMGAMDGSMTSWSTVNMEAKVTDLNGDALPDVILSSDLQPSVSYFLNQGQQRFNPFQVSTENPARHLTLGDFDGDEHLDLAFVEAKTATAVFETLSVAFGDANGTLTAAASMGQVTTTKLLTSIRAFLSSSTSSVARTSSDIVAISDSATAEGSKITVFGASGDRQLLAPYLLPTSGSTNMNTEALPMVVSATAIGHFDGGDYGDIAAIFEPGDHRGSYQLLLLHVNGDGSDVELTAGTPLSLPSSSTRDGMPYHWRDARLLAWRQGNLDDLIIMVPTAMGMGGGFAIVVVKGSSTGFVGTTQGMLDDSKATPVKGETMDLETPPCVTDLVSQPNTKLGPQDLAILTHPTGQARDMETSLVHVFSGGSGALASKDSNILEIAKLEFDTEHIDAGAGAVKCSPEERTNGFACIKAAKPASPIGDASSGALDSASELVLLSDNAWYIAKYRDGVWKLEGYDTSCSSGGARVGAGDVTGDGVDDLVIAGGKGDKAEGSRVYRGQPVIK